MKKLEKDLYIQHAKRLNAILDEKSTFINFLSRSDFKQTIQNELNVLAACERKFAKVDIEAKLSSKVLVKKFNKATKGSFKIDENYKYEDETDLIDAINYLATFCNNMFKVNIDDVVAGKNVTATDPKIDLRAKPEIDEGGQKINPNFAFAGGIPLASTPYENPYLLGKAYAKLTDDMKQGRFYKFKTKPTIIPVLKWISVIFLGLLSIALIVSSVFAFMANQLVITDGTNTDTLRSIGSGIIYLLLVAFTVYPMYTVSKTLSGKNPNAKYHFSWGMIMAVLALAFLMVLLDLNRTWLMNYQIVMEQTPASALLGFNGWKISFIVCCGLVGAGIIPLILASIFNPKPDPEAIDRKIKEYVDLFSAESGTNPVPPKADIQKPTEVKPSKSKGKKTKK